MAAVHCNILPAGYFEKLNDEQKQIVLADPSYALLIPSHPGTGKTRVLTYKYPVLVLNYGIQPANIVLMTFTKKAATVMRHRIKELTRDYATASLSSHEASNASFIGTIHSFAHFILSKYFHTQITIIDTGRQRRIILNLLKTGGYTIFIDDACKAISKLKTFEYTMEEWHRSLVDTDQWSEKDAHHIQLIYEKYSEYMKSLHLYDYDDLLFQVVQFMDTFPIIAKQISDTIRVLMVDEYQDVNPIQFRFITHLVQTHKAITVVGDKRQAIYHFRYANGAKNFDLFRQLFGSLPTFREHELVTNYRSTVQILSVASCIFSPRLNIRSSSGRTGSPVHLASLLTEEDECRLVTSRLMAWKQDGYEWKDMVVLMRLTSQSARMERMLKQYNVPVQMLNDYPFFERREVRILISYLKALANPHDVETFTDIFYCPYRGSVPDNIVELFKHNQMEQSWPWFSEVQTLLNNWHHKHNGIIQNEASKHGNNNHGDQDTAVSDLLLDIIQDIQYEDIVKSSKFSGKKQDAEEKWSNVCELVEIAKEYESVRTFLSDIALHSDHTSMSHRRQQQENDEMSGSGTVRLSTIHTYKGLESKCVCIIGMSNGILPHYLAKTREERENEKNITFVAITRAIDHLLMTFARKKTNVGKGPKRTMVLSSHLEPLLRMGLPKDVFEYKEYNQQPVLNAKRNDEVHNAPRPVHLNGSYNKRLKTCYPPPRGNYQLRELV